MCGIYGMISGGAALRHPQLLEAMGEALRHRGPDGTGALSSERVSIGTHRLRIIDLHARADQPFSTPSGDVWLQANGEIYNAREIRARHASYPFRSESDVESILPLYLEHGADAVPMLDGMFGLAIWDDRNQTLLLARDRAGEKPLFYASVGGETIFASELQCLLAYPDVARDLDLVAIGEYLRLGYIPEPRTAFGAIRRVPAGTIMRFAAGREPETIRYWDASRVAIEQRNTQSAIEETRRLVEAAVAKQVAADVPVGVFISGGMDSSILATLASRAIGVDKVHTFSARFTEASYDESGDAAILAQRMRTRHVTVPCDETSLTDALQHVVRSVAEPLADPAILPTFLLARTAHQHVKVVLSGEGADELFGGYPTYIGHKFAPRWASMPGLVRVPLEKAIGAIPPSRKKVTLEFLAKKFLRDVKRPWLDRHLSWFGTGLPREIILGPGGELPDVDFPAVHGEPVTDAMLVDYRSYLRDNLLVKVDRATMLSSVEARAPFLDRFVTSFALSLPASLRVKGITTKWILKKAAEAWLPRDVIYRRKRGLSVPVASWINGGLRSEVDRLLDPQRLRGQGLVDEKVAARLLAEHRSGAANHAKSLWALIVLQYWMENWDERGHICSLQ